MKSYNREDRGKTLMTHVGLEQGQGLLESPIRTDTSVESQTAEPDKNQEGNS